MKLSSREPAKPLDPRELGWDTQEPTWKDIADAAKAGKFTFGMTNPTSSNTGLTATIGLAAALAKDPDALTEADLSNPRLADSPRIVR
jgi:Ca-activated chloride channel homolog